MNTLGNKIKVFRKLKGISQLDLETAIGASAGSLSRIESDEVNPTKETITKLIKILNLNQYESDYLNGSRANPPSKEEIAAAIDAVKQYFSRPLVLGYLLDDRNRLLSLSNTFIELGGFTKEQVDKFIGKYFTEIVISDELGVRKYLDTKHFEDLAKNVFNNSYLEMYYMIGDPCYEEMMSFINNNQEAKHYWDIAKKEALNIDYRDLQHRTIHFNIRGHDVKLIYSIEDLWSNQKFRVIEYVPTNIIFQIYRKIQKNYYFKN